VSEELSELDLVEICKRRHKKKSASGFESREGSTLEEGKESSHFLGTPVIRTVRA